MWNEFGRVELGAFCLLRPALTGPFRFRGLGQGTEPGCLFPGQMFGTDFCCNTKLQLPLFFGEVLIFHASGAMEDLPLMPKTDIATAIWDRIVPLLGTE